MTKKQLVRFLEGKQAEVTKNAKNAYEEALQNHKVQMELDMKMDVTAKNIAMLISQADDMLDNWLRYINETPELEIETVNHYNCLKTKLSDLVFDSNIKTYMYRHIRDVSKRKSQLEKRYRQVETGIICNYSSVIANVQQLKDAKLGVQYLTELGFDLTELLKEDKHPMTTALSVDVDTSFLFTPEVKSSEK